MVCQFGTFRGVEVSSANWGCVFWLAVLSESRFLASPQQTAISSPELFSPQCQYSQVCHTRWFQSLSSIAETRYLKSVFFPASGMLGSSVSRLCF
jgi:hypothetical protein